MGFESRALITGLLLYVVIGVYLTRDILFLQWCRLTRLRAPVLKGFLYVGLYYVAATVLVVVLSVSSEARGRAVCALGTPIGAFYVGSHNAGVHESYLLVQIVVGLAMQCAVIWALVSRIKSRLTS